MVAKSQRSTWWFFVLLVVLLFLIFYGVSAVRTDQCSEDAPRSWQWFPPKWECARQL